MASLWQTAGGRRVLWQTGRESRGFLEKQQGSHEVTLGSGHR